MRYIDLRRNNIMKCIVQRVLEASVTIDGVLYSKIDKGILVLAGYTDTDDDKTINYVCDKLVNLRIFEDENGKLNKSLLEVGGAIMLVSNFTVYGDTSHGRRPSFVRSARGDISEPMYNKSIEIIRNSGVHCETGVFGADMKVALVNDGPVTVVVEREND